MVLFWLKLKKNSTGNVILLALLMLAGGLVGVVAIALIVISGLRQSKNLDNALTAYFVAESGLEQSLYEIRYIGSTTNCIDTINPDDGYMKCGLPYTQSESFCHAKIDCERKIDLATQAYAPLLKVDDNFQVDLDLPADGTTNITVNWKPEDIGKLPRLEVSYLIEINDNGSYRTEACRPANGTPLPPYSCNLSGSDCTPIDINLSVGLGSGNDCPGPSENITFKQLRFKALSNNILALQVSSNVGMSQNYLDIKSRYDVAGTRQVLQAKTLKQAPSYGFSDYVIFSEQDIVK